MGVGTAEPTIGALRLPRRLIYVTRPLLHRRRSVPRYLPHPLAAIAPALRLVILRRRFVQVNGIPAHRDRAVLVAFVRGVIHILHLIP